MNLTIEQYSRGLVGFDIPDAALDTICFKRQIEKGTLANGLSAMVIDLATADLYMYCASTPSVKGATEDAHGSWRHKDGGWETSAYDKRNLRQMANDIYSKYGEKVNSGTFKIIQLR